MIPRRTKTRYSPLMDRWELPPVEVSAAEFVDQFEAARMLKVSMLGVGRLIGEGRLAPVTLDGAPGVSRASVDEELLFRKRSPIRARLRSVLHWL